MKIWSSFRKLVNTDSPSPVGISMSLDLLCFTNYCFFIYYWCSQTVFKHYKQNWGVRRTSVPGNMSKGFLSTFHIKLDWVKNYVKSPWIRMARFPSLHYCAKPKDDTNGGSQTREMLGYIYQPIMTFLVTYGHRITESVKRNCYRLMDILNIHFLHNLFPSKQWVVPPRYYDTGEQLLR